MILVRGLADLIGAFLIFSGLCSSVAAQVTGGTLLGTVTDTRQATIPGAEVTILNQATGVLRKLVANEKGFFSAPNLLPGTYDVTVSATGFSGAGEMKGLERAVRRRITTNDGVSMTCQSTNLNSGYRVSFESGVRDILGKASWAPIGRKAFTNSIPT